MAFSSPAGESRTESPAPTWRRALVACAIAASSVALGAYAWLGQYARLMADDYWFASVRRDSVIGALAELYRTETGRYSSLLASLLVLRNHVRWMEVVPAVILMFWVIALRWFFSVAARRAGSPSSANAWALALVFIVITLHSTVSLGQSLYWVIGSFLYTVPLVVATGACALFLWWDTAHTLSFRRFGTVAGFILAFLIAGFSETPWMVIVPALLGLMWWRFRGGGGPNDAWTRVLVASLAGLGAGILIVAMAPANAVRIRSLAAPRGLVWSAAASLRYAAFWFARFFVCRAGDAAAASCIPAAFAASTPIAKFRDLRARSIAIVLICCFAVVAACFFPSAYMLVGPMPSRAMIIPQYVVTLVLGFAGLWTGSRYVAPNSRWLASAIFVAAFVSLSVPVVATIDAVRTAAGAAEFAAAWDRHDADIRAAVAKGAKHFVDTPLPSQKAIVLGLGVAGADPRDNFDIEAYYGLETYVVSPPPTGERTQEPWEREWCGQVYHHYKRLVH